MTDYEVIEDTKDLTSLLKNVVLDLNVYIEKMGIAVEDDMAKAIALIESAVKHLETAVKDAEEARCYA